MLPGESPTFKVTGEQFRHGHLCGAEVTSHGFFHRKKTRLSPPCCAARPHPPNLPPPTPNPLAPGSRASGQANASKASSTRSFPFKNPQETHRLFYWGLTCQLDPLGPPCVLSSLPDPSPYSNFTLGYSHHNSGTLTSTPSPPPPQIPQTPKHPPSLSRHRTFQREAFALIMA